MKTTFLSLIVIILLGFTPRENFYDPGAIENEAREFYETMESNWENLKFDEIFNCFHNDAICVMNNKIHNYEDLLKLKEYYTKNYAKIGMETEKLIIKPINENSASITAQYLMKSERANGEKRVSRNIHSMNLLKVGKDWKVIADQVNYTISPLLYSDKIEEKYKGNEVDLNYKFRNMLFQYTAMVGVTMGYIKEKGLAVEDYSKFVAQTFEAEWDKDMDFDGFTKAMRWQMQSFGNYLKLLEQDEDHLTFKTDKSYSYSLNYGGTEDDILTFYRTVMNEIGNKRGSQVIIEEHKENPDYLIYTVKRN